MTVSDTATREALEDSARAVEALGAHLRFGPQTPALLADFDLVIANPAIPFDHEVLRAAEGAGIPVTTEMNLFLERVRAPVFGVTGTKGKSTTVTLLARMLEAAGRRVHLGGNVGHALTASADAIAADDVVVLELSSFQLYWTRRIERSPHVTLVTNLFGDHLDRHGTLEHYAESKRAALDFQGPGDVAVLPADDADVAGAGYASAGAARRVTFGDGGDWRLEGARIRGPGGIDGGPLGASPLGRAQPPQRARARPRPPRRRRASTGRRSAPARSRPSRSPTAWHPWRRSPGSSTWTTRTRRIRRAR